MDLAICKRCREHLQELLKTVGSSKLSPVAETPLDKESSESSEKEATQVWYSGYKLHTSKLLQVAQVARSNYEGPTRVKEKWRLVLVISSHHTQHAQIFRVQSSKHRSPPNTCTYAERVLQSPAKHLSDKILLKACFLLKRNSVTLRKKYLYEKKPNLFWKCYKQSNAMRTCDIQSQESLSVHVQMQKFMPSCICCLKLSK